MQYSSVRSGALGVEGEQQLSAFKAIRTEICEIYLSSCLAALLISRLRECCGTVL